MGTDEDGPPQKKRVPTPRSGEKQHFQAGKGIPTDPLFPEVTHLHLRV